MNKSIVALYLGTLFVASGCASHHNFLSNELGQSNYECDADQVILETKKGNVKVKRGERTGAKVNTEVVTWYCGQPTEANVNLIHCQSGTDLVEVARNYTGPEFVAFCYDETGKL